MYVIWETHAKAVSMHTKTRRSKFRLCFFRQSAELQTLLLRIQIFFDSTFFEIQTFCPTLCLFPFQKQYLALSCFQELYCTKSQEKFAENAIAFDFFILFFGVFCWQGLASYRDKLSIYQTGYSSQEKRHSSTGEKLFLHLANPFSSRIETLFFLDTLQASLV